MNGTKAFPCSVTLAVGKKYSGSTILGIVWLCSTSPQTVQDCCLKPATVVVALRTTTQGPGLCEAVNVSFLITEPQTVQLCVCSPFAVQVATLATVNAPGVWAAVSLRPQTEHVLACVPSPLSAQVPQACAPVSDAVHPTALQVLICVPLPLSVQAVHSCCAVSE